ncbi:uncharacterized protein [Dermacentor albipictus]|uniref:uncharacterized protein n=1 Tax=Dermacentor albipictus TaxID=60249 RepID=UPI0038FD0523
MGQSTVHALDGGIGCNGARGYIGIGVEISGPCINVLYAFRVLVSGSMLAKCIPVNPSELTGFGSNCSYPRDKYGNDGMVTTEIMLCVAPLSVGDVLGKCQVGGRVAGSGATEACGERGVCNESEAEVLGVFPKVLSRRRRVAISPYRVGEIEVSTNNEGVGASYVKGLLEEGEKTASNFGRGMAVHVKEKNTFLTSPGGDKFNEKVFDVSVVEIVFDGGDSLVDESAEAARSMYRDERLVTWEGDRIDMGFLNHDDVRLPGEGTKVLTDDWLFAEIASAVPLPDKCISVSVGHDGDWGMPSGAVRGVWRVG